VLELRPIRLIRNLGRLAEIITVLVKHGFGEVVDQLHLRRYVPFLKRRKLKKSGEPRPGLSTARRIRLTLEELGPTFIKFGQVMSTRPDLIPRDVIEELAHLQEQVPPFPSEQAARAVEEELHRPVDELFAEFDRQPLAAGSLGQVHRARHHDGTPLAVKIRRPNVSREVERDLSLMQDLAALAVRRLPGVEVFDPVGLVNQFARTIRREMNFRREGRTIQEFARLFKTDATLYVPRVYDDLMTEAVLTMEFIDGCRADDAAALRSLPITPRQLAANGAHIYMRMAFEFGLFHGDPHPGNIRVAGDGAIALIDYGMVGTLGEEKREQLVDLFCAIAKHDVDRAVDLVQEMGHPSRAIDDMLLRADVQDFVETYYGVPLEQLKVGNLLNDFITILVNHGLRCPADFMLLIRAIVTLEGVGRSIDPHFNLAGELAPFVEKLVKQRYDPRRMLERTLSDARRVLSAVHDIPLSMGSVLEKLGNNDLRIQLEHQKLDEFVNEFDRSSNRVVVGLITASLIVASALVIRSGLTSPWIALPIFLLSGFLGVWLIFGIMRSGRL
jgi:ubiquinone biosynthesis protein